MARTYRISKGNAAYLVGFSLLWFGFTFGFVIIGQLAHDWTAARAAGAFVALLFALFPAFLVASIPYEVTLSADGECEFRSLVRRRRIRVQQMTAIDWDEEDIYIRYDRGKVRILADAHFKDLLIRILQLNPAIRVEDGVRDALAEDAARVRNGKAREEHEAREDTR